MDSDFHYSPTVDVFILLNQFGICIAYILFISNNVKAALDDWFELNVRLYMVIILLPLILIMSIRNLKALAPFSAFAVAVTFIGENARITSNQIVL